jgi:hypothetical protein
MGMFVAMGAAHAQNQLNVYFGLGPATDSSSNRKIDTFNTGNPYTTPKMAGLFSDIGASYMFSKHYGLGGDFDFRNSQAAYAGLNYRPSFYNFDAIVEPGKTKHFVPELRGGLGGVNVSYSYSSTACDPFAGCSTSNQYVESAHHFQVHMEAAARYYVTEHLFLRPAVEAHWVNNFSQFGSNWVPQYSLGVGWSFGSRE